MENIDILFPIAKITIEDDSIMLYDNMIKILEFTYFPFFKRNKSKKIHKIQYFIITDIVATSMIIKIIGIIILMFLTIFRVDSINPIVFSCFLYVI